MRTYGTEETTGSVTLSPLAGSSSSRCGCGSASSEEAKGGSRSGKEARSGAVAQSAADWLGFKMRAQC